MAASLFDEAGSHGPTAPVRTARRRAPIVGAAAALTFGLTAAAQQPAPVPVFQSAPAPAQPVPQAVPPSVFVEPAPAPAAPAFPAPVDSAQPFQAAPIQPSVFPQQPVSNNASMREIFANTLAVAAQATGTTLVTGLVQAISGGLTSWFNRKLQSAVPGAPGVAVSVQAPMTTMPPATFPPQQTPPVFQPVPSDPATTFGPPVMPADPASAQFANAPPQFFDAQTGVQAAPDPVFAAPAPNGPDPGALFAGLAYEVHAVVPGGGTVPVNPALHEFRTGDRFVVFYRPTLPGRLQVFNINPAGVQTQIDASELAGGQLAQLGPYEFAALKGEDRLRLVMQPCSTPDLMLATRDIVNVSGSVAGTAAMPTGGLGLSACSPATRSVDSPATRDIRKVALEGTTAFALDPVSSQEQASGQLDSREVTIVFRHR